MSSALDRRALLKLGALGSVSALARTTARAETPAAPAPEAFDLEEATVVDLQKRMESGQDTSRIAVREISGAHRGPRLARGRRCACILEINPDALAIADSLDAERKAGQVRGPLHGIPILIKDNIATADRMMTTAGSLALAGATPPKDAFIVDAAARGRRGDPRQDEPERVGELPLDALDERLERPRRPDAGIRTRSTAIRRARAPGSGVGGRRESLRVAVGTETDGSIVSPVEQQRARRHQAHASAW